MHCVGCAQLLKAESRPRVERNKQEQPNKQQKHSMQLTFACLFVGWLVGWLVGLFIYHVRLLAIT
jgi:hypothetical protein